MSNAITEKQRNEIILNYPDYPTKPSKLVIHGDQTMVDKIAQKEIYLLHFNGEELLSFYSKLDKAYRETMEMNHIRMTAEHETREYEQYIRLKKKYGK